MSEYYFDKRNVGLRLLLRVGKWFVLRNAVWGFGNLEDIKFTLWSCAVSQKMDLFYLSCKDSSTILARNSMNFNYFIIIFKKFLTWSYLYQLYSTGSNRCAEFSKSWNKIGMLFDHELPVWEVSPSMWYVAVEYGKLEMISVLLHSI